jgi:hypothetical protein
MERSLDPVMRTSPLDVFEDVSLPTLQRAAARSSCQHDATASDPEAQLMSNSHHAWTIRPRNSIPRTIAGNKSHHLMLCERDPSCVNHFQSLSSESIYLQHWSESIQPSPKVEACLSICVYVHISRDTTVQSVNLPASGPGCMEWLTRSYPVSKMPCVQAWMTPGCQLRRVRRSSSNKSLNSLYAWKIRT